MSNLSIFFTAVALSMDAFAVALCKGLLFKKLKIKYILKIGLYFGLFQAIMPLIGYLLSYKLEYMMISISHYIAFFLLVFLGINMIKESFSKESDKLDDDLSFKTMLVLSLATSIDALTVGISFAFLEVDIIYSIFLIGIITFIISSIGVKLGNIALDKYKNKSILLGGLILIIIGIKTLIEHLFT